MKGMVPFAVVLVLVGTHLAFGQGSMYDYSYQGPRNVYGQPQYEPAPNAQPAQRPGWQNQMPGQPGQNPWPADGYIPQGMNAFQRFGSYLWSFMPAPLRGAPDPNAIPAAPDGNVTVIYVPGNP